MAGKQVTELDALPSFTDNSLLPVHNGAGLKKGLLSQLANYLGTKFSNPNLLINPDFRINQRGASSYTSGYSVDRWKIINATLNASTLVLSSSTSSTGALLQSLENKPTGTFTVTVNVASVTGTVKLGWKDGNTYKTGATITKGLNTYTFSASSLTWVGIDIAEGASVQLSYMKLEQGTVATPFIAPNNSDELDKCLRYFESGSLDTAPGLAIQSTVYIRTYIHPKRINPTPKFNGDVSFEMNGTGKGLSLTYIGTDLNTECCTFKFKPSEATQYGLGFCKNFAYEIDAEIYS